MESKLVIIMIVSIAMGSAIGYGIGYSVFNPQIVILDHNLRVLSNEFSSLNSTVNDMGETIATQQVDLAEVNETLNSLSTEWATFDYETLNATVNEIADRKWNLAFNISNSTASGTIFRFNSTTFPIQGKLMKVSWYFHELRDGQTDFIIQYVNIYHDNGTLYNEIGMYNRGSLFTAEKEFNVVEKGDYYLSALITIGYIADIDAIWSINVWDYY